MHNLKLCSNKNFTFIYQKKLFSVFCCHFLQKLIFEKPPPNVRKIVLATNMAEASITINDVVFVVDCGKAKETTYDALNNTPCLLPSWISQASARQVSLFVSQAYSTLVCPCTCNDKMHAMNLNLLSFIYSFFG